MNPKRKKKKKKKKMNEKQKDNGNSQKKKKLINLNYNYNTVAMLRYMKLMRYCKIIFLFLILGVYEFPNLQITNSVTDLCFGLYYN